MAVLLGLKIKELRIARGMTQIMLAEKSGVIFSVITALETGRRKYISAQDVEKLAKALGVKAETFWAVIPGNREARYIAVA